MERILYVITRSEPGGAQSVVFTLIEALREHFEVTLVTGEEGGLADQARGLGVRANIIPDLVLPVAPRQDCRAVRRLASLIRQQRPDLVHAHSSKAGALARIAARICGVPAVFTAHGWAFTGGARLRRKLVAIPTEWLAGRLGQHVICVSAYDYGLARAYRVLPPQRMEIVHNGLSDVAWRAQPRADITPKLVMVARFAPPKDHLLVVRALSGLHQRFQLWLVGEGPTKEQIQSQAARLGLGDRVRFLGLRSDVPELLAQAHVFVLASNYEGLPISILEAMRAGLPVVATDVGGVCECVRDHETGFLVPKGDEGALRDRLAALIDDAALRATMGAAGRQLFESHFTAEVMVQKTLRVYERVLGRRLVTGPVSQLQSLGAHSSD